MAKKTAISRYLSQIGTKGGKAGKGPAKARSSEQARKAAKARWAKKKRSTNSNPDEND